MLREPHYNDICAILDSRSPDYERLLRLVIEWRLIFSLDWFEKYILPSTEERLRQLWAILFRLTDTESAPLSVATYNAIGAMLLSLCPFYNRALVLSFSDALSSISISPNSSIAVISVIVFFSSQIPKHLISSFIESIPLLPHFGTDLHSFIQSMPPLVSQMGHFPLLFHKALLRSLLISFGRSPTPPFVESVSIILSYTPRKLLPDFFEFVESNKMEPSILAIASKLIENSDILSAVPLSEKEHFLSAAENVLRGDSPGISEVEQAVAILNSAIKSNDQTIAVPAKSIVKAALSKQYPPHLSRMFIVFSQAFEEVIPMDGDSSSVACAKVEVWPTFCGISDHKIVLQLLRFSERFDTVGNSIVEFMANNLNGIMERSGTSSEIPIILSRVILQKKRPWTYELSVMHFLEKVDHYICHKFHSGFYKESADLMISCSASSYEELCSASKIAIFKKACNSNIDFILDGIMKLKLPKQLPNICQIVSGLIDLVPSERYATFASIIFEAIEFFDDDLFVYEGFDFLSKLPKFNSEKAEEVCLRHLGAQYYAYTHQHLFDWESSDGIDPTFSSYVSDIVMHNSSKPSDFIIGLKKCLCYYVKHHQQNTIVFPIIELFPAECLEYMTKFDSRIVFSKEIEKRLWEILEFSSNVQAYQFCCILLMRIKSLDTKRLATDISNILQANDVTSADSAIVLYQILLSLSTKKAESSALSLLINLPFHERQKFALKFFNSMSGELKEALPTQFDFLAIEKSDEDCLCWLKKNAFEDWPLFDAEIFDRVPELFLNSSQKVTLCNPEKLDSSHIQFYTNHREIFDIQIDLRGDVIRPSTFVLPIHFEAPTMATATPQLRKGNIVESVPLLMSFFNNSPIAISTPLFNQISAYLNSLPPSPSVTSCITASNEYSNRVFKKLHQESPLLALIKESPKAALKYLNSNHYDGSDFLNAIQRIIEKISSSEDKKETRFLIRLLRSTIQNRSSDSFTRDVSNLLKDQKLLGDPSLRSDIIAISLSFSGASALIQEEKQRCGNQLFLPSRRIFYLKFASPHSLVRADPSMYLVPIVADHFFECIQGESDADSLLPYLTDFSSPLPTIAGSFLNLLVLHQNLIKEATIELIPKKYFDFPNSVNVIRSFFKGLSKGAENQMNSIKLIKNCQDLFIECPSVVNAARFAHVLAYDSSVVDAVSIIFGKLIVIDSQFMPIFLVFLKFWECSGRETREDVKKLIGKIGPNFPYKNRIDALRTVAESTPGSKEKAFLQSLEG